MTGGVQMEVKILNIVDVVKNVPALSLFLHHFVQIIITAIRYKC